MTVTIEKPLRGSLRDQIYQALRDGIWSGAFAPGQNITIMALAEQMQTSAMPVREALRQLVAEEAVQILPNRTVMVPVLSHAAFDEITTLRRHAEGLLAERAATRITDADLKKLRQLEDQMARLVSVRDLDAYLRLNREFHFTVYRAGRSEIYMSLVERLWLRVGPLIRYALNDREFESSSENHQLAMDALARQDGDTARRAFEQDIAAAAEEIKAAFNFTIDGGALLASSRQSRRTAATSSALSSASL